MKKITIVAILVLALVLVACAVPDPGDSPLTADVAPVPGEVSLSGEGIAAIVALITSLALVYIPGLAARWEYFDYKREVLGALGLVVAVSLVGLNYAGAIQLGLGAFGWPVVWLTLRAWLAFAGAAQLSYTVQQA
jgi:hypothetical protein